MLKSLEVELTPCTRVCVIIIKTMTLTVQTSTCMAMVLEPCLFDSCQLITNDHLSNFSLLLVHVACWTGVSEIEQ